MVRINQSPLTKLSLLLICLLGLVIRLHAQSPYLLYSDSYQSLVIERQLATHSGLFAQLGDKGVIYPSYFGWSHPGYPIVIYAVSWLSHASSMGAAQTVNMIAAVGSIVLCYLLVKTIWRSAIRGLLAALLMAVSFNASIWTGFVLTESLAIACLCGLLYVTALWYRRNSALLEIILGGLLVFAVAVRYEYAALLLPLVILLRCKSPMPSNSFRNTGFGATAIFSVLLIIIYPIHLHGLPVYSEFAKPLMGLAIVAILGFATASFISFRRLSSRMQWLGAGLLLAGLIAFVPGLQQFVRHDFLLVALALLGAAYAVMKKGETRLIWQTYGLAILSLVTVYVVTNRQMERYWAHFVPLLLLPAIYSYDAVRCYYKKHGHRMLVGIGLGAVLVLQITVSIRGIHSWSNGIWYSRGYEQVAAQSVAPLIQNGSLVIAATPEPVFLKKNLVSVRSINHSEPYISTADLPASQKIVIINDMTMRVYFPAYYHQVEQRLSRYKLATLTDAAALRITNKIYINPIPIQVYELSKPQYDAAMR